MGPEFMKNGRPKWAPESGDNTQSCNPHRRRSPRHCGPSRNRGIPHVHPLNNSNLPRHLRLLWLGNRVVATLDAHHCGRGTRLFGVSSPEGCHHDYRRLQRSSIPINPGVAGTTFRATEGSSELARKHGARRPRVRSHGRGSGDQRHRLYDAARTWATYGQIQTEPQYRPGYQGS